jgi:CheY-like chemotaxis protein
MNIASKGKVLIADDEPTFVDALADLLRREGYECQTVPDGLAAAAELNTAQQYDLLIADIRMPGNPDLELIKHLPQIAEGLPVILVTAYPDQGSALRSAELPVLSYLIKPVDFPELLVLVRRGIEHSAVFRANREIARRLANWASDTKMVEQVLAKGATGPAIAPAAFVNLAMRNLLGCLSELDALWRRLAPHGHDDASPGASENDRAVLGEAIERAMRVFDLTIATFHQRDQK